MHARGLLSVANILISMPDAKRMQVGSRLPMKRIAAAILLLSTPATHATTLCQDTQGREQGVHWSWRRSKAGAMSTAAAPSRPESTTFGDIEGKLTMLHVECTRCSRKGRYNVSKLIAQYGARGI